MAKRQRALVKILLRFRRLDAKGIDKPIASPGVAVLIRIISLPVVRAQEMQRAVFLFRFCGNMPRHPDNVVHQSRDVVKSYIAQSLQDVACATVCRYQVRLVDVPFPIAFTLHGCPADREVKNRLLVHFSPLISFSVIL